MANPVVHFEIVGKDQEALKGFYRQTFDWEIDSNNPAHYGMVNTGAGIGGGIGGTDDAAPRATFYVEVEDPQATLDKVEQLGGKVHMPVTDIPGGVTMALFADLEGNVIGLVRGEGPEHTHPH